MAAEIHMWASSTTFFEVAQDRWERRRRTRATSSTAAGIASASSGVSGRPACRSSIRRDGRV